MVLMIDSLGSAEIKMKKGVLAYTALMFFSSFELSSG